MAKSRTTQQAASKNSQRRSPGIEIRWSGKDDAAAREQVPETALERVELLDPGSVPGDDPQISLPLGPGRGDDWRNLLIKGDNLMAMQALRERLGASIDLVYIDPPFATGGSYYSQTELGRRSMERRAYRDGRGKGMASYLSSMYQRLTLIHELLHPDGKLFVHCDWRANSMLRLLLDEIFGPECFRNEIVWRRAPNLGRQAASKQLGRVIDTIYVYSRTAGSAFAGSVPRRSTELALDRKGAPKGARWDEQRELYFTTAPRGDYTDASIERLREEGRVFCSASGTVYIKYFLRRGEGGRWFKDQPVDALWDDFEVRPLRHRPKAEDMGYDTQKPEGLLERIINWATRPGDLVADVYCGSGTTPAVAEALGRRWVACDVGASAIQTTRRRMLELRLPEAGSDERQRAARPFELWSTERAARRRWLDALEPSSGDDCARDAGRVLELFAAEPHSGRMGRKEGSWVWVAEPHAPPTGGVLEEACAHVAEEGIDELQVLAWEWGTLDLGRLRARMFDRFGVRLLPRTIPAEAIEPSIRKRGLNFDAHPEIHVEVRVGKAGAVSLRLLELCWAEPPELLKGTGADALGWQDLVSSWAVDWHRRGVTFEPSWHSHRGRKGQGLVFETPPRPALPGAAGAEVMVKVVSVFGDEVFRELRVP